MLTKLCVCVCVWPLCVSVITFNTSLKQIHSPPSCDGNLYYQFLFCCTFFQLGFVEELQIDNLAKVWQLRSQIFSTCVCLYFLQPYSCQLLFAELSVNSLLIKNLFCYLRSDFFSPPFLLGSQCVNHYRRVRIDGQRAERIKKVQQKKWRNGVTFNSGRKIIK